MLRHPSHQLQLQLQSQRLPPSLSPPLLLLQPQHTQIILARMLRGPMLGAAPRLLRRALVIPILEAALCGRNLRTTACIARLPQYPAMCPGAHRLLTQVLLVRPLWPQSSARRSLLTRLPSGTQMRMTIMMRTQQLLQSAQQPVRQLLLHRRPLTQARWFPSHESVHEADLLIMQHHTVPHPPAVITAVAAARMVQRVDGQGPRACECHQLPGRVVAVRPSLGGCWEARPQH